MKTTLIPARVKGRELSGTRLRDKAPFAFNLIVRTNAADKSKTNSKRTHNELNWKCHRIPPGIERYHSVMSSKAVSSRENFSTETKSMFAAKGYSG